jgi:hypothetical protein
MSTTQDHSSGLLSLPNELLARVCIYAADKEPSTRGKEWLRAVRLTCKQFHTPATEEFAMRFFTKFHFMFSQQSLQELVDLCKHQVFASHVQEVVFHPYRLNKYFLHIIQDKMRYLVTRRDFKSVNEARRHVEWYFARLEDEMRLDTPNVFEASLEA